MKTYVIIVSRYFPATHKRRGEETFFREKILSGQGDRYKHKLVQECFQKPPEKIHTIRANFELWANRIKEVQEGKAVLSLRYWSGKPYRSKQVEICRLAKDDGVGVQLLRFPGGFFGSQLVDGEIKYWNLETLAKNDGLSFDDFREWFRSYDLTKPMAIIHFTKFRY